MEHANDNALKRVKPPKLIANCGEAEKPDDLVAQLIEDVRSGYYDIPTTGAVAEYASAERVWAAVIPTLVDDFRALEVRVEWYGSEGGAQTALIDKADNARLARPECVDTLEFMKAA